MITLNLKNCEESEIDLGMAILIAPEANQFKVWVSIPNEMILQSA
jgi:hypothetical protein